MPHMNVRNHMDVPLLAWYFRIKIGWGTGNRPTNVPCCKNLRISLSSVKPLWKQRFHRVEIWNNSIQIVMILFYLSMQIFSTWGTSTCSNRMMVWSGSFDFQLDTQSGLGTHCRPPWDTERVRAVATGREYSDPSVDRWDKAGEIGGCRK